MATLAELLRQHTELSKDDSAHLQQLIGEWGMLADLCFADMILYLRNLEGEWVIIGGTVLSLLGIDERVTMDIDMVAINNKQSNNKTDSIKNFENRSKSCTSDFRCVSKWYQK